MRKILVTILAVLICSSLAACSQKGDNINEDTADQKEQEKQEETIKTAEECINALKDAGLPIGQIVVYDETTDQNNLLGRPNQYTSKIDFEDTTIEQYEGLVSGGTIEMFDNESDCENRYEYLKQFDDPSLGAFGLNAYMYKSDLAILRVDYDVLPADAEAYETAFYSLFQQTNF